MYHNIATYNFKARYAVSKEQFIEQLKCIKLHNLTSIATGGLSRDINARLIHISFDDGCLSDYEIALPILIRNNLQATFFITTGYVGKPGYMDWERVRELSSNGFDVQSHTHSHSLLATLDAKKIKEEMDISREILEQKLGKKIEAISLPGGSVNKKVLDAALFCGYKHIFTSLPRVNNFRESIVFGRVLITGKLTREEFEKIILGNQRFYRKLAHSYKLRKAAKIIIGANSYHFLWRRFYKNYS